jgi:hypothetical protein
MADSLIPPNSTCYLELTEPQAAVLFSIISRATGIAGSKQTHRSRMLNHLKTQLEEFEVARMALVKEHATKDDKGEPVLNTNTNAYTLATPKEFQAAFVALRKEQLVIVDGRSDELKNRALCAMYDVLNSDQCPDLLPPQPGRALEDSEVLLFAPVLDAFVFSPRPKP